MIECYLGLGGNIGDSFFILNLALIKLQKTPGIHNLKASRPFFTTPVSDIPQKIFVNAVCQFQTSLSAAKLFTEIEKIEKELGKTVKEKNAPRAIDIDLLFYDRVVLNEEKLKIPHPHWQNRLFVVAPLCDLVETLVVPQCNGSLESIDLVKLAEKIANEKKEYVVPLKKSFKI